MDRDDTRRAFEERVEHFVEESLSGYDRWQYSDDKSIRDAIWGTNTFYSWEIAILDSPLLQRLRDIRQTGLAYLVYPTAAHSRFDHTLGMVAVASKIVRGINDKYHLDEDPMVSHAEHMCVRLSAILHDVGHSCLSHVSESIYGESEDLHTLKQAVNEEFGVTPKAHELMSWLIVRSRAFKRFIQQLTAQGLLSERVCSADDVDIIAGNIIGYRKDPDKKFLADIVNGPMDADKLDYLVRDAYFAGPTVVYDLERFLHTVDVVEYPRDRTEFPEGDKVKRLSIPMTGVTALEQIIISKLMLFSYLYHHQKIRCVEGMCHEALRRVIEVSRGASTGKPRGLPGIGHPAEFLRISDRALLPGAWPPEVQGDKVAYEILGMLARRELYKRALIMSRLFIPNIDEDDAVPPGFERLLRCCDNQQLRDSLRDQIFELAKKRMSAKAYKDETRDLRKRFRPHHVLVDVPASPRVEEAVGVMVQLGPASGTSSPTWVPLSDIFPIEKWVDAYNAIKWRGHIFALAEAVPFVSEASTEILASPPYNLRFSPQATDLCKIQRTTGVQSASLPLS